MVWISLADSFCQHCHYSSLQSTVEWGAGWKGFLWHKYPFSYVAKEKIDPHNPLGVFPQPVWARSHVMYSRIGGDLSEWLQYYIGVFRRQTIWLRRRYPRYNILACIFQGFVFVSIYNYKKHCKYSATNSTFTALGYFRVRVTWFQPTYDTVLFKVLANISKFSLLDNLLYL